MDSRLSDAAKRDLCRSWELAERAGDQLDRRRTVRGIDVVPGEWAHPQEIPSLQ
jgi:hypothetical protein